MELAARRTEPLWDPLASLEKGVRSFLGTVLGRKAAAPIEAAPVPLPKATPRRLPCDLFLTLGHASIPIFEAGPIDEFRFFQRFGVAPTSELEWITRLDARDRGTEEFRAFALLRLGDGEPLAALRGREDLRRRLVPYGLERLPQAKQLLAPRDGANRVEPPRAAKPLKKVGDHRWSTRDVLEILRRELGWAERVAWIEEALPPPPPGSPVVHRYYLDAKRTIWLVRDERGKPRRLIRAVSSPEALAACATGAFARPA